MEERAARAIEREATHGGGLEPSAARMAVLPADERGARLGRAALAVAGKERPVPVRREGVPADDAARARVLGRRLVLAAALGVEPGGRRLRTLPAAHVRSTRASGGKFWRARLGVRWRICTWDSEGIEMESPVDVRQYVNATVNPRCDSDSIRLLPLLPHEGLAEQLLLLRGVTQTQSDSFPMKGLPNSSSSFGG